jgi:2-polyprenyl-3-methyl-5-hydroxy-6-metoxy-1,4-benzoquinol methylase
MAWITSATSRWVSGWLVAPRSQNSSGAILRIENGRAEMRARDVVERVVDRLRRRRSAPFRGEEYWRRRYSRFRPTIRAVGNSGLTDAQNLEDHRARWDEISGALGTAISDPRGRSLLDAGCGIGLFAQRYEEAGYHVVGVDIAEEAAKAAARLCRGEFLAGDLATIRLERRFSVVSCVSVLVHIVEDAEWTAAVENLIDHLEPHGYMLIVEPMRGEINALEALPHLRYRSIEAFRELLSGAGVEIVRDTEFSLPHEPLSWRLLLARRPATG